MEKNIKKWLTELKNQGNSKSEAIKLFDEIWIKTFDDETLERLAIMTVDGNLTDDEAIDKLGLYAKLETSKAIERPNIG